MAEQPAFDYYYGDESEQFSFFRIPRQLVTGEAFRRVSTDAKLLYGLLLDRMGLSVKNAWYDDQSRVFIYYTLDEIQADLCCGHEKAVKLLAELDSGKGIGLIERVKQGQGRPTRIYVKRFTSHAIPPPQTAVPQDIPRLPIFGSADFGKSDARTQVILIITILTRIILIYLSIHPAKGRLTDRRPKKKLRKILSMRYSVERPAISMEGGTNL